MREALHEFFHPTKEAFEKLWKDALISFDASSLLNLYGYSADTKKALVEAYEKFQGRIILPYQFAFEYSRNRASVINRQIANYQKAEKNLQELLAKHKAKQEQPYLSEGSINSIDSILSELADGKSKMEKSMASDEDSDLLLKLFQGKIGPSPTSEELQKYYDDGRVRYSVGTPPGFEDVKDKGEPDCYGDYVGWIQIMAIASERKRDVILVTDDVKEDWWHYEGSRLVGPLPALRREFRDITGQTIWLYTTEGFLRSAPNFSPVQVGDAALKEVTAAMGLQFESRVTRLQKARPQYGFIRRFPSTSLPKANTDKSSPAEGDKSQKASSPEKASLFEETKASLPEDIDDNEA